jgi:hypothetical protein
MINFSILMQTRTAKLVALAASLLLGAVTAPAQTLVGWGNNRFGQTTVPAGTYTAIAAGNYHSLALKTDGTLVGWGNNGNGEATVPAGTYTAIAAGGSHSLALKADGTLVAWGYNFFGQTNVPAGSYTAIGAGGYHNLAIRTDGTLAAWGKNDNGQTTVPAGTYSAIAAGGFHSLAITRPLYTFSGFLGAVNGPPTVNTGKAGRTYPVKFSLTNSSGAPVNTLSAVRSITYNPVACNFGASPTDAIEAEATGNSSLRYDSLDKQYIYNWASPSQPGCYVLLLTIDDGQSFAAWFNFK